MDELIEQLKAQMQTPKPVAVPPWPPRTFRPAASAFTPVEPGAFCDRADVLLGPTTPAETRAWNAGMRALLEAQADSFGPVRGEVVYRRQEADAE